MRKNPIIKLLFLSYKVLVNILWGTNISRFSFIQKTHRFLLKNLKPEYTKIHNLTIFCDEHDHDNTSVMGFKKHEHLLPIIENEINEGDTVIDVGANMGKLSLLFAQKIGKSGKLYCFEPEERNFEILQKNIKLNNFMNVKLVKCAVTDHEGMMVLETSTDCATHQVFEHTDKPHQEIITTSLDYYFWDYIDKMKIDFVKIDVEGCEPDVIKGMQKIIKLNPRIKLLIEYNVRTLNKMNTNRIKFIDGLMLNGFQVYDTLRQISTNSHDLQNYYNEDEPHMTDLFLEKAKHSTLTVCEK